MVPLRIFVLLLATLPLAFALEDLILTPFIREMVKAKAKAKELAMEHLQLSKVKSTLSLLTKSYSGFLTVNQTYNTNLFFWIFPALEKPVTSSVILLVNPNPGISVLSSIFLENGPFILADDLGLKEAKYTWARTHTLIYICTPEGLGFSFADKDEGLPATAQDQADEIHNAMKQIYLLFPEYQSRDLYLASTDYGARIAARMVQTFDKGDFQVNVKGLILGSPWINPKVQVKYGEMLLQFGLIDEEQSKLFEIEEKKLEELIDQKKFEEATEQILKIVWFPGALTLTTTGFTDYRSMLEANPPKAMAMFEKFIESEEVHNFLHVGQRKFQTFNNKTFRKHFADDSRTDVESLEKVLDKGIKVLIYAPQFDMFVPRVPLERMMSNLNWKGKEQFQKAKREIWKVDGDVAGYVKTSGNLQYVMMRNAGFMAIMDQPKWCYEMVENFVTAKMA